MTSPKKTWREKHLAREENGTNNDDNNEGLRENRENATKESNDGQQVEPVMDVNMVFIFLEEFRAPKTIVAELVLGAERVMFKKPTKPGENMKPLYVMGHLDGYQ
jgi:hypothetical protein